MWMKDRVLGDTRIDFSSLLLWAWAGLSITVAFSTFRKAREENDNGINRLPDDILGNIVSRLNIVEASQTSILSRRWRKIWTIKPQLIFPCLCTFKIDPLYHISYSSYGDRQRFFKAVNQCLKLHHSGCKLQMFYAHCCFLGHHACHLIRWMQSSAMVDVEELYLGQYCVANGLEWFYKMFTFSFKLIDGLSRLKKLALTYCYVETSFVGQCNSLVTITLKKVPLARDELSDILRFCPNLTSLFLECCKLPMNLRISGPNIKLETLDIQWSHSARKIDISDCNLVTIVINVHGLEVEISMSSLPKLETMYLQTHGMDYSFGDVARDLPQLQFLSIQAKHQITWLPPTFKVFGNVKILYMLTKGGDSVKAFAKVDLWNFARVLTVCPILEEFYLTVGGPFCEGERKEWCNALRHKHLQHMELSGFSNTQEELEFAKFILTSAEVLRLLQLRSSFRKRDGRCSFFESEEVLSHRDVAQVGVVNYAKLKGHAISTRARVEIC